MIKRMRSAWIGIAMLTAGCLMALDAEARGSHSAGGGSASRSCLTNAASNLLSRVEQQFGAMQIISTCRPGARIAGSGRRSRHASGNAVDFNAGSRKAAVVRWLIANHHQGGTMTYPAQSHIHIDIGQHFVSLAGQRTPLAAGSSRTWKTRMALGGPRRSSR